MKGVISFEYIVSPAIFSSSSIESLVDDLIMISNFVDAGIVQVQKEPSIIETMIQHKLFPSEKIFKDKLSKENIPYSTNDIVRMINNILDGAIEYDCNYLVEWSSTISITPDFDAISNERKEVLVDRFSHMALANYFENKKSFPLFRHENNTATNSILEFTGDVSILLPEETHVVPFNFKNELQYYSSIRDITYRFDGLDLFKKAQSALNIKMALYIGVINLIKTNSLSINLDWSDFNIGNNFIRSLKENEGFGEQRYSSVIFNAIINVLASTGKDEIKYFYKSDEPTKPRTYGDYTAYRVHITKQGRGLRLLFWSDGNEIIISNVGNKHEEIIYHP